jgi:hypothetical protein
VCGIYSLSQELAEDKLDQQAVPPLDRHLLQAWIKWCTLRKEPVPLLTDRYGANVVRDAPRYSPAEKAIQLLTAYAMLCVRPGRICQFQDTLDYPYAWAEDSTEGSVYFRWLQDDQLIIGSQSGITLTKKGWELYAASKSKTLGTGRTAFVAMWFDDTMDDAWADGIQPAIAACGFIPRRIKEEVHSEKIDMRIVAAIKECRFLVADATGGRTAVYYEAGLAEGLGKLVLWTCREDKVNDLSFDTRQVRHVVWKSTQELREKLTATIKALVV